MKEVRHAVSGRMQGGVLRYLLTIDDWNQGT